MSDASLNVKLKLELPESEISGIANRIKSALGGAGGGIQAKTISPQTASSNPQVVAAKVAAEIQKTAARAQAQIQIAAARSNAQQQIAANRVVQQQTTASARLNNQNAIATARQAHIQAQTAIRQQQAQIQQQILQHRLLRLQNPQQATRSQNAFAGMLRSLIYYRIIAESFKALNKAVNELTDSYARAQKIYAKSLTSGLGVGQTTKRGILASAIGVSEDEVMRFGDAVSYLNPKIEKAAKVLADTATPLTAVYLNFQSLKVSAQALFSTIAMNLKPAIEDIITGFQEMIDSITADDINMMGDLLRSLLGIMLQAGAVVAAVIGGLVTGFQVLAATINTIGAVIYNFIQQLIEWSAKLQSKIAQGAAYLGARSAGATKEEASKIAKGQAGDEYKQAGGGRQSPIAIGDLWKGAASSAKMTQEITDKLGKMSLDVLTGSGKESKERLAQPKAFMKQIPASSWEKMGLVIGGRGNTTNDLIRTSNQHLKIIADHVSGRGGVPRAFGLNPNVANP